MDGMSCQNCGYVETAGEFARKLWACFDGTYICDDCVRFVLTDCIDTEVSEK